MQGPLLRHVLTLCLLAAAIATNLFGQDDLVTLRINTRSPVCGGVGPEALKLAQDCLQPFQILVFSSPRGSGFDTVKQINPPIFGDIQQQPCTQIGGAEPLGGQLSLSGDGRFVVLACYGYAPGLTWQDKSDRLIGLLDWKGNFRTSKAYSLYGTKVFGAATDNSSDAWFASEAGLHWAPELGLPDDKKVEPVTIYDRSPVYHVTVVNRTHLWFSTKSGVLSFTLAEARQANAGGAEPQVVIATPSRFAPTFGHAVATYPRAGRIFADDAFDYNWKDNLDGPIAGSWAFLSHFNNRTGTNLFPFNRAEGGGSSGAGWLTPSDVISDIPLQSQGETPFVAAQLNRYGLSPFSFTDDSDPPTEKTVSAIANLYAATSNALYNYTFTRGTSLVYHSSKPVLQVVYRLPYYDRTSYKLAGVALAPYNVADTKQPGLPFPYAASHAPTPTPSISVSPTVNRHANSPSISPGAYSLKGDYGPYIGPDLSGDISSTTTRFLLLARLGGEPNASVVLPSTPDFRNLPDPRLAQPIFIDKFDRWTNRVVDTLPLPTRRNGPHAACTSSFAHNEMFPRIKEAVGVDKFFSLQCFDAEMGEIIPDSFNPPQGWRPPPGFPRAEWKHPRRVIANVHIGGFVDTRTIMDTLNCSEAIPTGVVRGGPFQRFRSEFYYSSAKQMADAPGSSFKRCGLRFVTHGSDGTLTALQNGYDLPLVQQQEADFAFSDHASTILFARNSPFFWIDDPEIEQLAWIQGKEALHSDLDDDNTAQALPYSNVLFFYASLARAPVPSRPLTCTSTITVGLIDSLVSRTVFTNPLEDTGRTVMNIESDTVYGLMKNVEAVRPIDQRTALSLALDPGSQDQIFTTNPRFPNKLTAIMRTKNVFVVTAAFPGGYRDLSNSRQPTVESIYRASVLAALNGLGGSQGVEASEPPPWHADASVPVGSSLLEYGPFSGLWNTTATLPCCASIWTSVLPNKFTHSDPLISASPSPSQTPSPSRTPSRTPDPFAVQLRAVPAVAASSPSPRAIASFCASGEGACLSPALPPLSLIASARGCPGPKATIRCSSSEPLLAGVWQSASTTEELDCPSADPSFVDLERPQLKVLPLPFFPRGTSAAGNNGTVSRPPGPLFIRCNVTSVRAATNEPVTAPAEVNLEYRPFQWPRWRELLLFFPKDGVLLSPTHGISVASSELARLTIGTSNSNSSNTVVSSEWLRRCGGPGSSAGAATNLTNGCLSEGAARVLANRLPLLTRAAGVDASSDDFLFQSVAAGSTSTDAASGRSESKTFSATVSRAAFGVLVLAKEPASLYQEGSLFTPSTRVAIGGYTAPVLWSSGDGTLLYFQFPPQLCASNGSAASSAASPGTAAATSPNRGCGYQRLTVFQSLPFPVSLPAASTVKMSCPPSCPRYRASSGAFEETGIASLIRPFVAGPFPELSLSMATFPASGTVSREQGRLNSLPSIVAGADDVLASTTGLFFAFACPGFVDPSLGSGICRNASNPLSSSCAFGDGAGVPCQKCPANSLCPGGVRAQPLPRYWAASETTGEIILCTPPSEERCLGWKDELGAVECGKAYDQSSYACLGCARGRYPSDTDNSCLPCDASSPILQIIERFLIIVAVLFAAAACLFFGLWLLAKRLGGTLSGGASRFIDLLLYMVLLLQMLAEVAATASVGLPDSLRRLYEFLSSFNLKSVAIHQKCLEGIPPFLGDILAFSFVLAANAVLLALSWKEWSDPVASKKTITASSAVKMVAPQTPASSCSVSSTNNSRLSRWLARLPASWSGFRRSGWFAKALCIALLALYTRTCNAVFSSLDCFEARLTLQQAEDLDGRSQELITSGAIALGGALPNATTASSPSSSAAAAAANGLVTVQLLRANPSFICYSGSHRASGVLAWLVLFFYLLGFPLWTLFISFRRRWPTGRGAATSSRPGSDDSLGPITGFLLQSTIRETRFFFRQVEMSLLFLLSLIAVLWREAKSSASYALRGAITCIVLLSLLAAMIRLRPYTDEERWRLPVRAASFLLACLVAIINSIESIASLLGPSSASFSSLADAVKGLSVFLIVAMVVYLLVLVFFIGKSMIKGAEAEAIVLAIRRKAKAAMTVTSAAAGKLAAGGSRSKRCPTLAEEEAAAAELYGRRTSVLGGGLDAGGTAGRKGERPPPAFVEWVARNNDAKGAAQVPRSAEMGRMFVAPPLPKGQLGLLSNGRERMLTSADFAFSAADADGNGPGSSSLGPGGARTFASSSAQHGDSATTSKRVRTMMMMAASHESGLQEPFGEGDVGDTTVFRVANPIGLQGGVASGASAVRPANAGDGT